MENGDHTVYTPSGDRTAGGKVGQGGVTAALGPVYRQNEEKRHLQDEVRVDVTNDQIQLGSLSTYQHNQSTTDCDPYTRTGMSAYQNSTFFNLRQNRHRGSLGSSSGKFYADVKSQLCDSSDLKWRKTAGATQRRFGEFTDSRTQDKSKFHVGAKNTQLSDAVLDRVIGPASEDLKASNIMDKDTVHNIKEAKRKVQDENELLKRKVAGMSTVLGLTQSENSKLRSHIRVLIEGQQGPHTSSAYR